MLGDADIAIGGGSESMSRAPYTVPAARFGQRMGDGKLVDMMLGALHDPFQTIHMGVTAENVAAKYGISRDAQDALALESHRRARAIAEGRFRIRSCRSRSARRRARLRSTPTSTCASKPARMISRS